MAQYLQNPQPDTLATQSRPEEYIPRRRNRTGCLTCRRRYSSPILRLGSQLLTVRGEICRKKRCDGVRNVCGHCARLNLVCHWQGPRQIGDDAASPSSNSVSLRLRMSNHPSVPLTIPIAPAPIQFLQSDASELARRSLDRKLALRYYVQTFNTMLTTNLENNGFLSGMPPLSPVFTFVDVIQIITSSSAVTYGDRRESAA